MAVPAKSVLNSIKDLQADIDRLTAEVAELGVRVSDAQQDETPGSNTDVIARLETLESVIWGKE